MDCLACNKKLIRFQKKYCSRSCAAIVNNSLYPKRPTKSILLCCNCGKLIEHYGKKYCSSKCMWEYKRTETLKKFSLDILNDFAVRSSVIIRRYLYKKQNNKCSICGISNLWNGKELKFILDHIDGNSENNKESNVRLVCHN